MEKMFLHLKKHKIGQSQVIDYIGMTYQYNIFYIHADKL